MMAEVSFRHVPDALLSLQDDGYLPRQFDSGATRDSEQGKYDFEGFLSPLVLMEYARYMDKHRHLADGTVRGSDNWQSGMPLDVYMKSLLRHVFDLWLLHREGEARRPETGELVDVHDALGEIGRAHV